MIEVESVEKLKEFVGREVALSEWVEVSQERVDAFAEATEDRQWIHTDPERAARESPFRRTIAHGFLTLSLLSELMRLAVSLKGLRMGVNCGLNRVRFVSPVPAGSRVRGRFTLNALEEMRGGAQATWEVTVEREGGDKPACVAEWLVRYYV
ncbi:MAG: MaoC family dehydratase [Acidobacteria bacterium]|nr:MaoC family dehydratase [Acidobacteriota bacterium]